MYASSSYKRSGRNKSNQHINLSWNDGRIRFELLLVSLPFPNYAGGSTRCGRSHSFGSSCYFRVGIRKTTHELVIAMVVCTNQTSQNATQDKIIIIPWDLNFSLNMAQPENEVKAAKFEAVIY
jgi:hypothetical protein